MKTEIKYRTFDELLNEVLVDFHIYSNEGMIEPAQLIKIAQKVNYDLGLKIHSTKEKVLEITKGKARLPLDFYVLDTALLCGQYTVKKPVIQGRQVEEMQLIIDPTLNNTADTCRMCGAESTSCGCNDTYSTTVLNNGDGTNDTFVLVEKIRNEVKIYDFFERIHMSPSKFVSEANKYSGGDGNSTNRAEIKNGFIYTNVTEGKLYIQYQGALEDEEGNLLVFDHPMVNEYYEYAIKQRILENLFMNGEDVSAKINLIEGRIRAARNNALSFVNTPDFQDIYKVWASNRRRQYDRYYSMFLSYDNITHK